MEEEKDGKRKKAGVRIIMGIFSMCSALGCWGVLYPELTMTPDTYRVVCEDGTVQKEPKVVEWDFDSNIYMDILNADRSRIRFRSKLLQELCK